MKTNERYTPFGKPRVDTIGQAIPKCTLSRPLRGQRFAGREEQQKRRSFIWAMIGFKYDTVLCVGAASPRDKY